jgi:hypothetical protein
MFGITGLTAAAIGLPIYKTWYSVYDPIKKTVCWPHYVLKYKTANEVVNYNAKEAAVRNSEFWECFRMARRGESVFPPSYE